MDHQVPVRIRNRDHFFHHRALIYAIIRVSFSFFFDQHNFISAPFFYGLKNDYNYYYDAFSVYLVQFLSSPLLCSYYHIEKYISFLLE